MDQRLTIITLGVNDLKTSTQFYENSFGWKKDSSSSENITFFRLNGIMFALFGRHELADDATVPPEGTGFRSFTLAYNVRSEADVDSVIRDLRGKGVKIVKEPGKVFWGGYSSYVSDPDGNLWEIAFNPYLKLDSRGDVAAG